MLLANASPALRITRFRISTKLCRQPASFSLSARRFVDIPSKSSTVPTPAVQEAGSIIQDAAGSQEQQDQSALDESTPVSEQVLSKDASKAGAIEHPLSNLPDYTTEISTIELVNRAFSTWKEQRLQKTSQSKIDEALKFPQRTSKTSVSSEKSVSAVASPFSSLKDGNDDFGMSDASNPFASQKSKETPLERFKQSIDEMDQSLHLGLKTGRQMEVHSNNASDLGIKLNMLGALTARNRIRQDERRQKFHERPGLKRKRLKRERWRKRFSNSFASICSRATSLARQGW